MPHGLTRYKKGPDEHGNPGKGCRCATCRRANRTWQRNRTRMIAYGRWDGWLDATGTQRRVQALMRNGWSMALLSARLGCTRQVLRMKLGRERVTAATARAIRGLYDELWDQCPPERTKAEKRAATMARRHARERGWPPPLGWDDPAIDNPDAQPADGWERSGSQRREHGTLTAEVLELTGPGFGLDLHQAAERLGVVPSTLASVLSRERAKEAATGEQDAAA